MADPTSVADPAGWRLADLLWESLTEAALAAHDAGRRAEAVRLWQEAEHHGAHFADNDPRRAATLNNAGVADGGSGAEALYRRALEAWKAADAWVGLMAVEPRARSSLFHLRLENKHRDRYKDFVRADYRSLLQAGAAVASANLAGSGDHESSLARWRSTRPAHLSDLRKLTAAALLSAGV